MIPARSAILLGLLGTTGGGDSAAGGDTGGRYGGLVFAGERPTNLLLVSLETVRRGDMGRYSGRDTTPELDRWFERSVVLDHHRSCSNWTYPSFVCIYTGTTAETWGSFPHGVMSYTDDAVFLAEILAARGYSTRMVAAQFVLDPEQNLTQGFDETEANVQWDAAEMSRRTIEAAEAMRGGDRPWFLHVHFFDPHTPYLADSSYRDVEGLIPDVPVDFASPELVDTLPLDWETMDEPTRAAVLNNLQIFYDADLRYMDEQVGLAMDTLERRGVLEDTLVVFITDHGEQFFEHGSFEHDTSLYGEETLATAAFWAEGLSPAAVTEPTSHIDIVPTVLDALGLPPAEDATGYVLGTIPSDRPIYTSSLLDTDRGVTATQSIEIGDDRLIYWWDGRASLYDLAADPGEQVDRYDGDDPTVQALWEVLAPYTEALEASYEGIRPEPVD